MKGKELSHLGKEIMELAGWKFYSMNSNHPFPRGMLGFADHTCFKNGVVIFAEVKGEGDKLRPKQEEFKELFNDTTPQVQYRIIESAEDWLECADYDGATYPAWACHICGGDH